MAIRWNRRKYSKEAFTKAVEESYSWRDVARALGKNPDAGGIYYGFKIAADDLGLSTEHFTGQGWNVGDKFGLTKRQTIPLEDILVENSTYLNTGNLKKRLLRAGLLEDKCYAPFCPVPNPSVNGFTGESEKLKLALDHENGNRFDNRIENLRLLCYHCHGQTDTYCSKNWDNVSSTKAKRITRGKKKPPQQRIPAKIENCSCGNTKSYKAKKCLNCEHVNRKTREQNRPTKIEWPPVDELRKMVSDSNYTQVAKKLGVSDNAIRKRLRNHS